MNQRNLDIWEDNKRKFFSDRLQTALEEWKSLGNGRTEGVFAKLAGISQNSITDYKKCRTYPSEKTLEKIAKTLRKPKSYFVPNTRAEKYALSPSYITKIGRQHVAYSKKIGLDLDFARALHNIIDYDAKFPLYSDIVCVSSESFSPSTQYIRNPNFMPSAKMDIDENLSFLQMQKDGQTVTMHYCDLGFLKEVQDQVVEYVEYLFYKRQEEMKKEVEEANKKHVVQMEGGGVGYRKLTLRDMLRIDHLLHYGRVAELQIGGLDNGEH